MKLLMHRLFRLASCGERILQKMSRVGPPNFGTPKGLRQLAQGCEVGQSGSDRATLGTKRKKIFPLSSWCPSGKTGRRGLGKGGFPWGSFTGRNKKPAWALAAGVIAFLAFSQTGWSQKTLAEYKWNDVAQKFHLEGASMTLEADGALKIVFTNDTM